MFACCKLNKVLKNAAFLSVVWLLKQLQRRTKIPRSKTNSIAIILRCCSCSHTLIAYSPEWAYSRHGCLPDVRHNELAIDADYSPADRTQPGGLSRQGAGPGHVKRTWAMRLVNELRLSMGPHYDYSLLYAACRHVVTHRLTRQLFMNCDLHSVQSPCVATSV